MIYFPHFIHSCDGGPNAFPPFNHLSTWIYLIYWIQNKTHYACERKCLWLAIVTLSCTFGNIRIVKQDWNGTIVKRTLSNTVWELRNQFALKQTMQNNRLTTLWPIKKLKANWSALKCSTGRDLHLHTLKCNVCDWQLFILQGLSRRLYRSSA